MMGSEPHEQRPARRGPEAPESLGQYRMDFRPQGANLAAGIVIGLLAICGAAFVAYWMTGKMQAAPRPLPLWQDKGESWGAAAMMYGIATILLGIGVWLIRWCVSQLNHCVSVFTNGFVFELKGVKDVVHWDEVSKVTETVLKEHVPLVKGAARHLMPTVTSHSYVVARADGKEFGFQRNTIQYLERLARILREECRTKRNIAWEVVEEGPA